MLELLTVLAACSPPPPGFFDTRPLSGSKLPANAQVVLIGYTYPLSPRVTITQVDAIYDVTPIVDNGIVRVDVSALGLMGDFTLFAGADDPGAMSVTADFSIDPADDTTPPPFNGIDSLSYEFMEEQPGLCWPGGFSVRAHITPAFDDWATTHYQLYEVMPNDALVWAGNTYHDDSRSLSIFAYAGYEEDTRCYVAFANDVGGNVTPELVRGGACIDLRREGSDAGIGDTGSGDSMPIDMGTIDTGVRDTGIKDAGTPSDSGGLLLDEDGGCGCTATSTEHSVIAIFLPLGFLALFRRKH